MTLLSKRTLIGLGATSVIAVANRNTLIATVGPYIAPALMFLFMQKNFTRKALRMAERAVEGAASDLIKDGIKGGAQKAPEILFGKEAGADRLVEAVKRYNYDLVAASKVASYQGLEQAIRLMQEDVPFWVQRCPVGSLANVAKVRYENRTNSPVAGQFIFEVVDTATGKIENPDFRLEPFSLDPGLSGGAEIEYVSFARAGMKLFRIISAPTGITVNADVGRVFVAPMKLQEA